MFRFEELKVDGCYLITPMVLMEDKCDFIKIFNNTQFNIYGLSTEFKEECYAIAKPGVVRGIHFQKPPEEHDKLVTCLSGSIQDVVVDLRKNSRTFGKYTMVELNENNKNIIYIPKGCAHGYYIKGEKTAIIYYKVTKPYILELRDGIHWSSLDIPWDFLGKHEVEVEEEDKTWPKFEDFQSPF
ncbi:MAG: dTDP-4-keto-6-deoxy-D-glucose epimerase [Clostridiales bacterium]|jgi:dTDP-4-dehydrorhamnose 3,5-epimerase|nr:dTDP-4-keto-6-deoxy-D-glucose epimerase [Clostridiales bacterium]